MSRQATGQADAAPRFAVDYVYADAPTALLDDPHVLAVFGFGDTVPTSHPDPRYLRVPLQPYGGPAPYEVWRTDAPVQCGREGEIAWSSNGKLAFGVIEVEENDTGIDAAAEHAYALLTAFVRDSGTPYLLRIWNYLDAITRGDGDAERYRQFCVGRARGLGAFDPTRLPAATAIGRCDDARVLQVYWLAAAAPGTAIENPRQVSAYRYPRAYGPQPPSFARAMLPPTAGHLPLLLSGTASVVGHATMHADATLAQVDETFANFASLLGAARVSHPELPAVFGAGTRLKVYVRDQGDLAAVAEAMQSRYGEQVPHIVLHAAICRRELCVEIDGVHSA
ncbi:pteridine-dependent deoxygenase [Cognatiluteimonas profundi]|uniref:chorismate transformation enzyme, FkbO/Hyg5 family n=1 Tax=Cognatiluteimonas profundi TaxID=2594501 RepID=UPI0018EF18E8|nr:pteridine-dependent deoxygenase [Lysobacter profundi]